MLLTVSAWPGRLAAWLILPIIIAVLVSIAGSMLRLSELVSWGPELPVLGTQLTLTGLTELQWHLFAVLVMLAGTWALQADRHVRVDFLHSRFSPNRKALVDLVGHALLLLPFCALMFHLSIDVVQFAWKTGEHSDYGGLADRWIIKLILPVGFCLLFLGGVGRMLELAADLVTGDRVADSSRER